MARQRPEGYDSNASRTRTRGTDRLAPSHFIGVDGEGWTDSIGVHRYSQLSVGDRTLFGAEHLSFTEIMEFLWDCFLEHPRAVYVGFFLGYDFSQWLRTLPEDRARMLLTKPGIAARKRIASGGNTIPFPVRYAGWEFDTLGDKRFKLRRETAGDGTGDAHPWMNICDTGAFFQASFLSVIDPKGWPDGAPATQEEYDVILEGKSHRADHWTTETWLAAEADLTRYNVAENTVLAKVMLRYEEGLRQAGVWLKRDQWYGPGAAAQGWMKSVGLTTAAGIQADVPAAVLEFARQSYYGGHFEVFVHGIVPGTSYEYDLNSAYPAAMALMPCWSHMQYATEENVEWEDVAPLALVDCTTYGSDPILGSAMHRRKDGTICRPQVTRGVRWSFEVTAGIAAGVIDRVVVHRVVSMRPRPCPSSSDSYQCDALSRGIPHIYQARLAVGKNTAHGKAYKLIYNSAYGKQAQSIGSPKYANPLSASYITAWCRTQIVLAVASHPMRTSSLLMVATDGVYFSTPHPTLPISPSVLGLWDEATKENLTIVMPGVHYDDSGRRAAEEGKYAKLRSRGIPADGFARAIAGLDAGFRRLAVDPTDPARWPVLSIPIRFQVAAPRQALHQGKWDRAGTVARDVDRRLSTDPSSKRAGPTSIEQLALGLGMEREPYLDNGVVRTYPYEKIGDGHSTPYTERFGMGDSDNPNDLGLTPEGDPTFEMWSILRDD